MYLEAKIKELLILQLDTLIKKPQNKVHIDEEDFKKLLKAKLILETNFTNAPTLVELSRIISLNEFKLKKGFKACFATTVKSYITKLRMEYAKDLFKNKASNVGEVAYKCGYKDVSHFSAAFKLFYGFTPISFRKLNPSAKFCLLYCDFLEIFSSELFYDLSASNSGEKLSCIILDYYIFKNNKKPVWFDTRRVSVFIVFSFVFLQNYGLEVPVIPLLSGVVNHTDFYPEQCHHRLCRT